MGIFSSFRKSNKGASLILVSAYSVIVIALAATLTVISSMLLSNAEVRNRQDRAYELATSLSEKIEEQILNEGVSKKALIDLGDGLNDVTKVKTLMTMSGFDGIPDSSVTAVVEEKRDTVGRTYYVLTVTASAAGETYIKTTEYNGSADTGYSVR